MRYGVAEAVRTVVVVFLFFCHLLGVFVEVWTMTTPSLDMVHVVLTVHAWAHSV